MLFSTKQSSGNIIIKISSKLSCQRVNYGFAFTAALKEGFVRMAPLEAAVQKAKAQGALLQ
jgi:hypothetical protein